MGLSSAFGCFKDPEVRARKNQKKAGQQVRNKKAQPNRVIAAAERGGQAGVEMRNMPERSSLPATMTIQTYEPSPSAPTDDEPEPWSVGAVIRRTSLLQAQLAEAANERKQTKEETNPKVIVEEKEDQEASTGETTSTLNMTSIGDGGGGGSAVRGTMMFGLPTTRKEPKVDLKAIEEEAEYRKYMEENALAAKGSHNGKYGGARNWNQAYSQRATPMSLHDRDTRKSGWGLSGLSGSSGQAMNEPYYDYATGGPSGPASNPYSSPYGYGRKRNSHYAYVSGPAN